VDYKPSKIYNLIGLLFLLFLQGCGPSREDVKAEFLSEAPNAEVISVAPGEGDGGNVYFHIKYKLENSSPAITEVWLYQRSESGKWNATRKDGNEWRLSKKILDNLGFRKEWPVNAVKIYLQKPDITVVLASNTLHAWSANSNDYNVPMLRINNGPNLYQITMEEYNLLKEHKPTINNEELK
jgi:hypothetical protein